MTDRIDAERARELLDADAELLGSLVHWLRWHAPSIRERDRAHDKCRILMDAMAVASGRVARLAALIAAAPDLAAAVIALAEERDELRADVRRLGDNVLAQSEVLDRLRAQVAEAHAARERIDAGDVEREHDAALKALTEERDRAQAKAETYARDWYAAKSKFGDAMAKMQGRVRWLESVIYAGRVLYVGALAQTNGKLEAERDAALAQLADERADYEKYRRELYEQACRFERERDAAIAERDAAREKLSRSNLNREFSERREGEAILALSKCEGDLRRASDALAAARERIGVLEEALLRIRACATDQLAMHTREGCGLDVTSRILAILADAGRALAAILADADQTLADDACLAKETET